MPGIVKTFIFFLVDTPTGNCYYLDSRGNIQTSGIHNGNIVNLSMKQAPDGWLNAELGYMRNTHYFGINRSYSLPLKMVGDISKIIRNLYYLGQGIETPLTLKIFKYNDNPQSGEPQYKLYYSGQLDLPKNVDFAGEGIQVNIMEGGVIQLLKAYENTIFEIPCDGSLQENIKINFDGMLLEDSCYHNIIPFVDPFASFITVLPTAFIEEDGDSVGVLRGDQSLEDASTDPAFFQKSNNFAYSFLSPTTLTISGNIIASSANINNSAALKVGFVTSNSVNPAVNPWTAYALGSAAHPVFLHNKKVFPFSVTINLAANENLFIVYSNPITVGTDGFDEHAQFYLSNIKVSFNSEYPATSCWGIKAFDFWKLLGERINLAAATTDQTFNYRFDSTLLASKLNYVITSGDALRASGDPNYKKFYNAIQVNPNYPSLNQTFSFGPVIKSSISEFFDSINAIENASLSNQVIEETQLFFEGQGNFVVFPPSNVTIEGAGNIMAQPGYIFVWQGIEYPILTVFFDSGTNNYSLTVTGTFPAGSFFPIQSYQILQPVDGSESLFLEKKEYVFDSSADTFDLGETTNLTFSLATEYFFNRLRIGYRPQTYDQKAGKYEWNTTAEWLAPIKTISKTMDIISPYRTDAYGIERLRSGVNRTSTTHNDSDNSVFLINVDETSGAFDKYKASFQSTITDITLTNNTNIHLFNSMKYQDIPTNVFSGSYLSQDNTPGIFIWNQPLVSVSKTINVSFAGTLSGLPGDTLKIKVWTKNSILHEWDFSMPADATFSGTLSTTYAASTGDTIYATVETAPTASALINTFSLESAGDFIALNSGIINIQQGSPVSLILLPSVTNEAVDPNNRPVMSYGFQYFLFNSILANNNFNALFNLSGIISGAANFRIDLYLNGVSIHNATYSQGSGTAVPFTVNIPSFNNSFSLGDIIFVVASVDNNNTTYITEADLDLISTQIRAYNLKRINYANLSGIPKLVADTSTAGAPYNIEDLSPKRILQKWGNFIRGLLYNQPSSFLSFYTLSKNQYLSTTYPGIFIFGQPPIPGETIQENASEEISGFDDPLFYPIVASFKTKVPDNFADVMAGTANAHVSFQYSGNQIFGFPMEMKQKPGLNEMQQWKILLSTKTPLINLIDLNIDGLNFILMGANSIYCPPLSPVQFVPEGAVLPSKYHTKNRDQFWFSEQIVNWINNNNYWQPWQKTDTCFLQFQTNGLSPVVVNLFSCSNSSTPVSTTSLTNVSDPAIVAPFQLWEGTIDLSGLAAGGYYLEVVAGSGGTAAKLISEGLNVQTDWPDTILFEYSSTLNKQGTILINRTFSMRVRGMIDNRMKPKYKGAFYIDQPQDIEILNAIPYLTDELWIYGDDGVPDYVSKKVSRIMLLNQVTIEGIGYSLDEGAEWEETFIQGNPKKLWKAEIRQTTSSDGVTANASGVDTDATLLVTLDGNAFGPNANNTGTQEPDLTQIITT